MNQSAIVSTNQEEEVTTNDRIEILMRPVMLFVLQQHNLQHLQLAMKQALRRAACRVYAMQALNWLLRSVTQPICLHDLLWWFIASLTPTIPPDIPDTNDEDNKTDKKDDHVSFLYILFYCLFIQSFYIFLIEKFNFFNSFHDYKRFFL